MVYPAISTNAMAASRRSRAGPSSQLDGQACINTSAPPIFAISEAFHYTCTHCKASQRLARRRFGARQGQQRGGRIFTRSKQMDKINHYVLIENTEQVFEIYRQGISAFSPFFKANFDLAFAEKFEVRSLPSNDIGILGQTSIQATFAQRPDRLVVGVRGDPDAIIGLDGM